MNFYKSSKNTMMKKYWIFLLLAIVLSGCKKETAPVLPSAGQVAYQQMEMVGFIHFTVNTFSVR